MSPRPGGEADKFGNRYEGRWTVRQLLYVLLGRVDSITVEEAGPVGKGAEFTVRRGSTVEVHQVKRQLGTANEWSVQALDSAGVLRAAREHVVDGHEFHFISIVPARRLDELTSRARGSDTCQLFLGHMLTKELRRDFDYLSGETVLGSAEIAWKTLRGMHIRWPDERDIRDVNSGFAGLLLEGAAPPLAAAGLGVLVVENLNVALDAGTIERLLVDYGLRRSQILGSPTLVEDVRSVLGRWSDSVARELLEPVIPRRETADIWGRLRGEDRTLFVIGAAGSGKSAVLHETVQKAESVGWPVLALRLDRLEPFTSPVGLGKQLGLNISPVSALAAVSQTDPCLLVVDQVDAVSLASGRMPASFDVVASVMREASGFPNMRVVLACRKFDVDNDERIRAVVKADGVSQIEVEPLSEEQIDAAVEAMDLDATTLTTGQRKLLRSPFNLVLLCAIADQGDVLSFGTSKDLLDAYWDRKRRNCRHDRSPAPRFNDVIGAVVDAMSERQRLAVPMAVLDRDDLADDARILESEHILVRDGRQYAFFHEEFFGYAFARRWIDRGQTLVKFLLEGEQELFRRGQIRQVLNHLHDDEPERFIEEAEKLLLHPDIRFHIKDVVLALLRALQAPTSAEWAMVKRIIASEPEFIERLWLTLRTLPWFDRLDTEGEIARWLSGDQAEQSRALEVILGGVKDRPDRIAQLIAPHAGQAANYPNWLRWVTRFANLHTSRALLDLVIDALRRGEYDEQEHNLWLSAYNLADHEPTWAIDLLAVYLREQPHSFSLDSGGQIKLLQSTDHAAIELVTKAADRAPQAFCESLLPYVQRVMQLTENDSEQHPIGDRQFSYRRDLNGQGSLYELNDAIVQSLRAALRKIAAHSRASARPVLESLATDSHETSQWLLYDALQEDGGHYAEWAAALLLEGDHRLIGSSSGTIEAAALLLRAIGPHVGPETFARLEQAILELRVPWESRRPGSCMFSLLAELPESRLSDSARRRLGELRRLFNAERPPTRTGLTVGNFTSPIPEVSAQKMTDENWLQAIDKYDADREDWTTMQGGVHELSNVLQSATAADPDRFARLAVRLTPGTNAAYSVGILLGLGNAEIPGSAELAFDAIRHIASLDHSDNDRWLAWPLRKHLDSQIPDDIILLLVDRALHSTSPEEEHWQQNGEDSRRTVERIFSNGINSARGGCSEMLGDILVHDIDGHRTSLVAPSLNALAIDPSVAVRSCAAHLIAACLRHAQSAAIDAFNLLIRADDRLLTTHHVANLIVYIGNTDSAIVEPVIRRMLASEFIEVRKAGGQLAAVAGLEWDLTDLMETARAAEDPATNTGVAVICAQRLPRTSNAAFAGVTLQTLADDPDEKVREAVAGVAAVLRGEDLGPFREVLVSLIASPSFNAAVNQLLITLEHATDRIDDLIMACAKRFIDVFGSDMANISTSAAANADEVARLVLRAYEQARTNLDRSAVLDLVDKLLLFGAYRVDELIDAAERGN